VGVSDANPVVAAAFEPDGTVVAFDDLVETRRYPPTVRSTGKYRQIATSIAAVGLVEPPVVRPEPHATGRYFLLDGHLRIMVLREQGISSTLCLVSTDDEAFTYNKRVSRLTAAQEHRMIARALERGVPEAQLVKALGFQPRSVQRRARMLNGVAPEASRMLEHADCSFAVYDILRKMTAARQVEAAELMIAQANISQPFARALLASTRPEDLVPTRDRRRREVTRDHLQKLRDELESLQHQARSLQDQFGLDALHFTLARGYLRKVLQAAAANHWLAENRPEYLEEFRAICEAPSSPDDGGLPREEDVAGL
jgi:ParB-like chromosome segregation protein Spo0J